MKKILLRLRRYNFLLILGLAILAILAIMKLYGLPQLQFLIIICLIFFYLIWAIVYHFLDKSLSLEVMVEYILTALLATVVAYGVLL